MHSRSTRDITLSTEEESFINSNEDSKPEDLINSDYVNYKTTNVDDYKEDDDVPSFS